MLLIRNILFEKKSSIALISTFKVQLQDCPVNRQNINHTALQLSWGHKGVKFLSDLCICLQDDHLDHGLSSISISTSKKWACFVLKTSEMDVNDFPTNRSWASTQKEKQTGDTRMEILNIGVNYEGTASLGSWLLVIGVQSPIIHLYP